MATAAGIEILNEPFQATMVSVWETPPTKPVILSNMTLAFIDNLLIVSPRQEVKKAIEEQNKKPSNVLDVDLLEENDLDNDELEEDELNETDRLSVDLLAVDFLTDVLVSLKKGKQKTSKLGDVKIEGITAGYDAKAQIYSFIDGEVLTFYRRNVHDSHLHQSCHKHQQHRLRKHRKSLFSMVQSFRQCFYCYAKW